MRGALRASGAGWRLKQLDYGEDGAAPYLTMEGYREFRKSVMPAVRRFLDLDGKGLSEEYAEWDDLATRGFSHVVYADRLQVILETGPEGGKA